MLNSYEDRDARRNAQAVTDMRTILSTLAGQQIVQYLLEEWGYGEYPALGLDPEILHSQLGTLRASRSLFELAAQGSPEQAGYILAKIEKERYALALQNAQPSNQR